MNNNNGTTRKMVLELNIVSIIVHIFYFLFLFQSVAPISMINPPQTDRTWYFILHTTSFPFVCMNGHSWYPSVHSICPAANSRRRRRPLAPTHTYTHHQWPRRRQFNWHSRIRRTYRQSSSSWCRYTWRIICPSNDFERRQLPYSTLHSWICYFISYSHNQIVPFIHAYS